MGNRTKKALIFGSARDNITREAIISATGVSDRDMIIAADGGYNNAVSLGFSPDIWIGDGDSLRPADAYGGAPAIPDNVSLVSLPAEKDVTDIHAAINLALERDAGEIWLLFCTGGRLDHFLGNIMLLEYIRSAGGNGHMLDNCNIISYYLGDQLVNISGDGYKYLSVVPLDREISGIYLTGVKYPLSNASIERGDSLGISNEIIETAALKIERGAALIIRSRDAADGL